MKSFELRFMDFNEVLQHTQAFLGDEYDVLIEAQRLSGAHAIEVWEGDRKVARVKWGNAEIGPVERVSD